MSRDNLGNKQTIILHNCLIYDERHDLVITPHRQTKGYIRTKRQILGKKVNNKQEKNTRKRFSKRRNAVSESETSAIKDLHNLKDSVNKNHPFYNQICFSVSETTSPASIKGKRRKKTVTQTNQYVCTIRINQ